LKLRVVAVGLVFLVGCATEGDSAVDDILMLSGDVVAGETLYGTNCESCHAEDGSGGIGNDIREVDAATAVDAMWEGRDGMVSFSNLLTEQEIADIAAYVETF